MEEEELVDYSLDQLEGLCGKHFLFTRGDDERRYAKERRRKLPPKGIKR
jgi:hypothetical protein